MRVPPPSPPIEGPSLALVPRMRDQGYSADLVGLRREWVEGHTGARLAHVGACTIPTEAMRGNVENPIGAAQVPLGVAGPLRILGEHARGDFYAPLATTEGALVRSYERGMVALTRSGGVTARVLADENRAAPVFVFDDVAEAHRFAAALPDLFGPLRDEAEATTRHGRLVRIEPRVVGREVIVGFCYHTADAHGMNMIVRATDRACRWLVARGHAPRFLLFGGACAEKKAAGALFSAPKGKRVTAGALVRRDVCSAYLHARPDQIQDLWHRTVVGHLHAGAIGYNGHIANGLAALFIACGQDVANVVNSAVGITNFDVTPDGDLYASVTLPSLTVATVGGGTGQGTALECLAMLGCSGTGCAPRFAEIVAAVVLAGELSMGAAIASGEFVQAHESYGRNRSASPSEGPA